MFTVILDCEHCEQTTLVVPVGHLCCGRDGGTNRPGETYFMVNIVLKDQLNLTNFWMGLSDKYDTRTFKLVDPSLWEITDGYWNLGYIHEIQFEIHEKR